MKIWLDADASPVPVKEIVFRAAERRQVETILVANQYLRTPPSRFIRAIQVPSGFDVADNYLVQEAQPGDLVVTADIPLAAELVEKRVHVISPRGQVFDASNVRQKLVMRDFMEEMRGSGLVSGGPSTYGAKEKQAFANALDRILTQHLPKA